MPINLENPLVPLTGIIVALLAFAAWRDVATRTIPDSISVALLALGAIVRLDQGWEALAVSLLTAVAIFLAMLPFHGRGLVGGADMKLLAALAAGLPPLTNFQLITSVALFGGLLAALYLSLRRVVPLIARLPRPVGRRGLLLYRVAIVEVRRIQRGAPLPYGVAIAAGAAVVVLNHSGV